MNQELFNALLPYFISALGTVLTAVAAWLGKQLGDYVNSQKESKLIRSIISETVKYVRQVGQNLEAQEKFDLAKRKATEWANSKGLAISEIELEILIESFVGEFKHEYEKESVGTE